MTFILNTETDLVLYLLILEKCLAVKVLLMLHHIVRKLILYERYENRMDIHYEITDYNAD